MIEIFVPRENVNDDSVIIRAIHFKSGAIVSKGQLVVEIETSKTNIDIESPNDGLLKHSLEVGKEIAVGGVLFTVGAEVDGGGAPKQLENISDISNIKISKAGVKRAKELGVPLEGFGSGWITSRDIEKKYGLVPTDSGSQVHSQGAITHHPNEEVILNMPFKRVAISKRKQSEIKNLQIGRHHATSSTIGIDIKIPGKRYTSPPYLFQNSISDLIVYEASRLLRSYPELNASYIDSRCYGGYDEINFGWSFDTGSNLKVLAIKNSDMLSLTELHQEIERLLEMYESNQNIPIDLLTASTVTISDLSQTDASFILPLINGHQSLILGVITKSKNIFSIMATFDHRVSEGLTVTKFLTELKARILSYYYDDFGMPNLTCYACEKTMQDELSLRHRGFIQITLPNGDNANLCRNCFDGL